MFRSNYDNPNVRSKYHLTKELGCGAYGTVYLAKHRISGEEFAVKEIPKWKVKNLSGT